MKTWMIYWLGLQASQALAAGNPPSEGIQISNPLRCEEATECVQNLLNGLIFLAAPIAAIMILVGGFQIMSSGGNQEKLSSGKKTIIYAAVGYAIILLASGVTAVIRDAVSGSGSSSSSQPPPADSCPLSCPLGYICTTDPVSLYKCIPGPN